LFDPQFEERQFFRGEIGCAALLSLGGMNGFSQWAAAFSIRLCSLLRGTTAGPDSPPLRIGLRVSSTRSALALVWCAGEAIVFEDRQNRPSRNQPGWSAFELRDGNRIRFGGVLRRHAAEAHQEDDHTETTVE